MAERTVCMLKVSRVRLYRHIKLKNNRLLTVAGINLHI